MFQLYTESLDDSGHTWQSTGTEDMLSPTDLAREEDRALPNKTYLVQQERSMVSPDPSTLERMCVLETKQHTKP